MRYKRKLIALLLLMVLLTIVQYTFPGNKAFVETYDEYIFRPFQSVRNIVFGIVPISVGDILYVIGVLILLTSLIKWIYFSVKFKSHKHYLGHSLLTTILTLATIYLLFFIGWGGNYYNPKLSDYWQLKAGNQPVDSGLLSYDTFLIHHLNDLAPQYQALSFRDVNNRSRKYYQTYTDSRTSPHGLGTKPSVFGYFMQYLGIQGYYNPFTGEAQVNRFLPSFMLPFVVCHEMAHQSGIAAEDDANLLSYALCNSAQDKAFSYSAYFNLWLYTQSRLRQIDSAKAHSLLASLNPLSLRQLDTLREIRHRYRSNLGEYSSVVYDRYLRMHHQKDGIESYYNVALSAWEWEQQKAGKGFVLTVP